MKFHHKLLALAAIGLAAAAPAHAAITNSGGGNGELFLSIWHDNGTAGDTSDDLSYTRDLNQLVNGWGNSVSPYNLDAGKTTAGYSLSFSADALLSSFLSALPGSAALHWNVAGVDSSGTDRMFSTIRTFPGVLPNLSNFRTWGAGTDVYLAAVNAKLGAGDSTTAVAAEVNAFAGGGAWNDDFGNRATGGLKNDGIGLGSSLSFYMFYETVSSGSTTLPVSFRQFTSAVGAGFDNSPATWNLGSDGTLTYSVAAVPEAETWAMFAAGLLAVGAIARRRLSA